MKEIQLTQGYIAIVDDEDYDSVSKYRWHIKKKNTNMYARREVKTSDGKYTTVLMHSLLISVPHGMQIDHINGNGLDNRKENLRACTNQENGRNRHRTRSSCGYKGVSWKKETKRWSSRIRINAKLIHLGYFSSKLDAARAYDAAALKYFGEFARINTYDEA